MDDLPGPHTRAPSCQWRRPLTSQLGELDVLLDALQTQNPNCDVPSTHAHTEKCEGNVNSILPRMSSLTGRLWSERNTMLVPRLVWHVYDPLSFVETDTILWLLLDSSNGLLSLYHRNSHPEETLIWQSNETLSLVCITLWLGFCISVMLGFVSDGW